MPPWTVRAAPTRHADKSRDSKAADPKILAPLPSMDQRVYYDPPSSPSASSSTSSLDSDLPPTQNLPSNSGNKHILSARFTRRNKIYAWSPIYEDVKSDYRTRKRMKACLESFLPDAAAEVGAPIPENIIKAESKREKRKRKREVEGEWVLPHLRSPSPPLSTAKLAPTLALPQSYVDIMLSPAMQHSLGDDTVENGLQRTTQELLDGENGLLQACGRLKEILRLRERDVLKAKSAEDTVVNGDHAPNGEAATDAMPTDEPAVAGPSQYQPQQNGQLPWQANGTTAVNGIEKISPLPHISDTDNLWRVTQELLMSLPPPTIEYSATEAGAAMPSTAPKPEVPLTVTPIHRLFTCPDGITVSAVPHPSHPGFGYNEAHRQYPRPVKYNLDMPAQCRAVDDALERVAELLADCMEYKERLEEARDRIADVARARKRVWGVVKERTGLELDLQ